MIRSFVTTIAIILLFVSFVPSVCSASESKTVFVLFDLSGSTASLKTRKEYLNNFRKILDMRGVMRSFDSSSLGPGDVLVADIISGNSISSSTFPIKCEIRRFNFWEDNNITYSIYLHKIKLQAEEEAKQLLLDQHRKITSTDIFSAIRVAARVFKLYKRDRSVLVIMSDMIEESNSYDFTRMRLNNHEIRKIIAREKAKGLPDLSGVEVYIAGCKASSSNRFIAIKNFWMRYFKACGAVLKSSDYGRAFVNIGP